MKITEKESRSSPSFTVGNRLKRVIWNICYFILIRYSPIPFKGWRRFVFRVFGAKLSKRVNIYPSAKIWLPSNLTMEEGATLGPNVNLYNQGHITIGRDTIISQGVHLCASTHDYNNPVHPLVLAPIIIKSNVWVCADAFIGPGVVLEEGTVIGARAVANKSSVAWSVYAGNPAKVVNSRVQF